MKAFSSVLCSLFIFALTPANGRAQESATAAGGEAEKPLPRRLQKMVETYEREKTRLLIPVEAKYDHALQRLKVRLTQNGELDGALEVKALIAARSGESAIPSADEASKGLEVKIANTKWKWGETSGILELKRNGDAMHSSWGRTPGQWKKVTDDILKLTSPGTTFIVHFMPDGTAIVTSAVGSSVTLTPL